MTIYFKLTLPLLIAHLFFTSTDAAQITVTNNCSYTVWAAAIPSGGGQELPTGASWTLTAATTTRIWARMGCSATGPTGLNCTTGDCNGLLQCTTDGSPPRTLAEYAAFNNLDAYDIALIDGFNVPMSLTPASAACRVASCAADVMGQCPGPLRADGGCNSPCTVFKTNDCCNSGVCQGTNYSRFFKEVCPYAYNFPSSDEQSSSSFTCTSGTNYKVVFCP